jgi:hypothetical protein
MNVREDWWAPFAGCLALVVYASLATGQAIPGLQNVVGQYRQVTPSGGGEIALRIDPADPQRVIVEGAHEWGGTYDTTTGQLSVKRNPQVDEFPKGPDWAKAMAAKEVEWKLTVKAAASADGLITLDGNWDIGKVTYSVGTQRKISVEPHLIATRYSKVSSVPCHQYPGLAKWREAVDAEAAAGKAQEEVDKLAEKFAALDKTVNDWKQSHQPANATDPAPSVPDEILRPASDAARELQNAKDAANRVSTEAKTKWDQVAPPAAQQSQKSCEICNLTVAMHALSGLNVTEDDLVRAAAGLPTPFNPLRSGTSDKNALDLLKKYGFKDAVVREIGFNHLDDLQKQSACGPLLLSIKTSPDLFHSVFIYSVTKNGDQIVLKGWDPSRGIRKEWTRRDLIDENWDQRALILNPCE